MLKNFESLIRVSTPIVLKEIQKKAQEDLGWIKEKAQVHEQVIEKAMAFRSSPFPLGESH